MTDQTAHGAVKVLVGRVKAERQRQGLSLRALGSISGVSFSTLARVERGEGQFDEESERRLRIWLGDDVGHLISADDRTRAEELGVVMARSCAMEIQRLVREASLSPTTTDAVRGEVESVAWQFQLAHSRDVNGEYFGWGPMRVAFEKPCVPEGSIRKLQPLYSATLHPSPEDPIGGQDVEAVAKIIHDECEDDDDSCGGAYMRAAKRILAALRAPVERKGEG